MPDRPKPPPRPPSRRDIVGPEEEDVTNLTDRQIILRSYDAVLHLKAGIRLELTLLDQRIGALERHVFLTHPETIPLPPMRPKLDSSLDARVDAVSSNIAEKYDKDLKDQSTPPPDKARMQAMVAEGVRIEMMRIKAENWERIETERKAAETERLAVEKKAQDDARELKRKADEQALALQADAVTSRRRFWYAVGLGIFTTLGTTVAFLVEHYGHH